jgi:hypothetical protein
MISILIRDKCAKFVTLRTFAELGARGVGTGGADEHGEIGRNKKKRKKQRKQRK